MIHIILFVITISISVFSPKVHAVKSCSESGHTLRRPLISDVPTSGHFKLYFEVNKNFNPNYPTTLAIYDGQQPTDIRGLAEESKLKYYNNENINIVFVQYRGIFCSKFPAQIEQDQVTPFLSNEAIEDFEAVRRELLGNSKWMIVGGSGGALLALQYLAKYPNSVSKAFVSTPPVPGEIGGRFERESTAHALELNGLYGWLDPLSPRDRSSFAWILNRIGYDEIIFSPDSLIEFKKALKGNNKAKDKLLKAYGDIFSVSKEINKNSAVGIRLAEVFSKAHVSMALRYALDPIIPHWNERTDLALDANKIVQALEKNTVPVLITGGLYDHVVPTEHLNFWHSHIGNSTLKMFPTTHTMKGYMDELRSLRKDFLLGH